LPRFDPATSGLPAPVRLEMQIVFLDVGRREARQMAELRHLVALHERLSGCVIAASRPVLARSGG